jgi:hypothetical protein
LKWFNNKGGKLNHLKILKKLSGQHAWKALQGNAGNKHTGQSAHFPKSTNVPVTNIYHGKWHYLYVPYIVTSQ